MKNCSRLIQISFLVLLTSCGSLKLSPQACRTDGVWGDRYYLGKASDEVIFHGEYYVWNVDHEVRLRDFLRERKIECGEVKRIRVSIKSVFFVKRELTVFVQK